MKAPEPSALIVKLLLEGKPSREPAHRQEQIQWARSVLWNPEAHTPYRQMVAAIALRQLSTDPAEQNLAATMSRRAIVAMRKEQRRSLFDWFIMALVVLLAIWIATLVGQVVGASQ